MIFYFYDTANSIENGVNLSFHDSNFSSIASHTYQHQAEEGPVWVRNMPQGFVLLALPPAGEPSHVLLPPPVGR